MKKRIIGIDVARALAVIGMIIVNFKIVLGDHGAGWPKTFANTFNGKAAATFVVLAGIGLALMTNSAVRDQSEEKLQKATKRILKRAVFLFAVGLSYIVIWPADILHYYGIYMLVVLLFLRRTSMQILLAAASLILIYPLLMIMIDYETGWNFTTLEYIDFWTVNGFLRNLFYNGFHPVIPWTAFMLFGFWYGRQNLYDTGFVKKSIWMSACIFIATKAASMGFIHLLSQGDPHGYEDLLPILGTEPMPPLPIYMLSGISISIFVTSSCIWLADRYSNNKIILALNKTGRLALTFYVAHVILGMGIIETFGNSKLGEYSIGFSVSYALLFSLLCILFAVVWLRYKKSGPLEWIMRKLTD